MHIRAYSTFISKAPFLRVALLKLFSDPFLFPIFSVRAGLRDPISLVPLVFAHLKNGRRLSLLRVRTLYPEVKRYVGNTLNPFANSVYLSEYCSIGHAIGNS